MILRKISNFVEKNNCLIYNHIRKFYDNNINKGGRKMAENKEVKKEENIEIYGDYYSLENQEKKIYINILQLVLEIIIVVIIAIGIISATNIINASISERKQEFKILSD